MYIQDNKIKITYASSATEEDIQKLIADLKKNITEEIDIIQIDNEDMPISLLFYFVDLLRNSEIELHVNPILFSRLQKIIDAELFQNQIRIVHE